MKIFFTAFTVAALIIVSCTQKNRTPKAIITIDTHWLDSVKRQSDTSWVKPYRNKDFVKAEYYVDRKDSIVTQLMKDSAGTIRQVNIAKYDNIRLFFAEYYANGQLMATLVLDSAGRYNGGAVTYYENGVVKSQGNYNHGFYEGEWKNFDERGKIISIDEYDLNGQLVHSEKK